MSKLIICMLLSCHCLNASVTSYNPDTGVYTIDKSGSSAGEFFIEGERYQDQEEE